MQIRKFAATAALSIAAIGVTAGTVHAAPAEAPGQTIGYHVDLTTTGATVTTDGGSLVDDNGVLEVRSDDGTVGGAAPLAVRVDDFTFPIAAQINGNTATLTPQYDLAHATYTPQDVDLPFQDSAPWKTPYDREVAAWTRLATTVGVGGVVGTATGAVAGAAIGCAAGAVATGLTVATITALFGGLGGAAVGCLAGASVVGFLGTVIGALVVTLPVAVGAIAQYFTTINAPFVPAGTK
ncbi:hypothetical protein [Nocardia stercoris]|uniref:DUF8020 domain-containing protein n=1 Tax=Nocardia stercoris TaxID=2483361 RepID=A0A3M2LE31_9NOCA|nr:hypothetical protein [Nocardia stercoris]RMI34235.1 hypothetical protein EBN03_07430 [Nocardia stercoris]